MLGCREAYAAIVAVTGVAADAGRLDACPVAPVLGRLAAASLLPLLRWMSQHATILQGLTPLPLAYSKPSFST